MYILLTTDVNTINIHNINSMRTTGNFEIKKKNNKIIQKF